MPATRTRPTTPSPDIQAILNAIAREHLRIDTLESRHSDRLDFHDCGVAGLRDALAAAYAAGRRHGRKPRPAAAEEAHGDLVLTKKPATRDAGDWTTGRLGAYRFEAKVYPEHATIPAYEIGRSRISKLCVRRLADNAEVYAWDRGLDRPAIDAAAQAAVDAIAARLAEVVFGPARD